MDDLLDYTYIFDPITTTLSRVQVIDHRKSKQYLLQVTVDDHQFLLKSHRRMPAEIADLVDVAVTVYVADRLSIRKADMPCGIHIIVPLRLPEILSSLQVLEHLKEILYWYTGDHWSFEFTLRTAYGRPAELQMCMPFTDPVQPVKVALLHEIIEQMAKQESIAPSVLVEQLLQLYKRYVHEWDSVQHIVGQGLLEQEEMHATP